jgi:hypothetical protein
MKNMEKPQNKRKTQANQYDKILKENIEAVIPALMEKVLGLSTVETIIIKEKIQHTKEREADALRIITDNQGSKFILHLEFQVADEAMINRMGEYYFMLKRDYNLPIKQFVIFLGSEPPKMKSSMDEDGNHFEFQLISISQQDYHKFLKSNRPEEIIFGILSNFGQEDQEKAILEILTKIEETSTDTTAFKRYFQQLRILAQLRNLAPLIDKVMDSIANIVKNENDIMYIIGKKETEVKWITNLLKDSDLSTKKIASLAGVSLSVVETIKQKLISEK